VTDPPDHGCMFVLDWWCLVCSLGEVVQLSAASSILRAVQSRIRIPRNRVGRSRDHPRRQFVDLESKPVHRDRNNSGHVDLFGALSKMRSRELPGAS